MDTDLNNNNMKEKFDYGEILFLGKCNNKCYYCLGNEMPKAKLVSNLNTPYQELKNLDLFINRLKDSGTDTIYLSSVITEPMLYKDINNLCDYLISNGFKVGIRTNGIDKGIIDLIPKLEAEISISINSLVPRINKRICGNENVPDIEEIFKCLSENNKKCRISIVVNKYNHDELFLSLKYFQFFDCISYIQLRKRYMYGDNKDLLYKEDIDSFERIKNFLNRKYGYSNRSNFHESIIYNSRVPISLWEDVFKKESLSTLNYFSDGKISSHNLLIPSYEKE